MKCSLLNNLKKILNTFKYTFKINELKFIINLNCIQISIRKMTNHSLHIELNTNKIITLYLNKTVNKVQS